MCGLVGIASFKSVGLNLNEVEGFTSLLIIDAIRGPHGTGVFSVDTEGTRKVLKNQGNPYNLITTQEYGDLVNPHTKPYITCLAGHNRWATTGAKIADNAHPFWSGDITFMHNGTLRDYTSFSKRFAVDSEAMCHSISERGIEKTVGGMFGAYAVVYYDQTQKTLNFARNDERPLWLGYSKTEKLLIWASERSMIEFVSPRHQIAKDFELFSLPTGELWSYSLNNPKPHIKKLPITGSDLWTKYYGPPLNMGGTPLLPKSQKKGKKHLALVGQTTNEPTGKASRREWVDCYGKTPFRYWVGDDIIFKPYDFRILNAAQEKYQIIGKREDMPKDISIKFVLVGKEMMEIIMDEPHLGGTISTIAEIDHKGKYQHTVVWVKDVSLSEPDGKRNGRILPSPQPLYDMPNDMIVH